MWTMENRHRYDRDKLRYPSDLTDAEWRLIRPLIPPAKRGGGKRTVNMREVVNGVMYVLSTGCQWRYIPKDLPPRSTVNGYFCLWGWDGTLEKIHHALYVIPTRLNIDRCPLPCSERSDALGMIGQKEPRPSARLDDGLVAFPDQSGEFVLPQILPNRLHWIEFRRVWRQRQQSDVVRHAQAPAGLMPAGAVTDQNSVRTRRHLSADFAQVLVHRLDVDARHDDGGTDASGWADRAEQIGRVMTVVAHHQRARADRRPNVSMSAFLPDPGFVLKPDFEVRCGCAFG